MEVTRIVDGLWRWTTQHPAWAPGADWGREVGCVYHEASTAIVLVDPQVPAEPGEAERFWRALDRDVERHGREVVILTTCSWHRRSAPEVAERYDGRVIGPEAPDPGTLPAGISAIGAPTAAELVWWLAEARAVVPGDTILGDDHGGLAVCPASWLDGGGSVATLAAELRPLLDLPVERVLVSHGMPVLSGGRDALVRALSS